MHFSSGSNGKQAAIVLHIFLHAEFSAMDYSLTIVSKCRFFFIFKHSRAPKRSWEIFREGPGKSWIFRLDALAKALSVIATATWLAGWLAGWLSHSGIVSKPLNLSENFFDRLKAPSF